MANVSRSTKKKSSVAKKSSTNKKAAKATTRKPAQKKAPSKKAARKSVVKKQVKKTLAKKAKMPVRSSAKKTGKKKVGTTAKVDDRKVLVCSACGSPHLRSDMVGDHILYTCLSCGFKSQSARSVPVGEVKSSLTAQKKAIRLEHARRRVPHVKEMRHQLHRFPIRVMFGLTGMILFVIGVVLLTSPEKITAGFLLVLGAVMAYLGEKV